MKKLLLVMMLAACSSAYAAEVYTCTVNGKTVYQGKPCAGKELHNQVQRAQAKIKGQQAAKEREKAEWNSKKEPSVGMTTTQVGNSTWGYPQKYSETQTAYGGSEFWHYGSGRMIHFRNGVVVALTK